MKYTENNKPIVCMQTNSTCYKGTGEMTVKGVLWHSTGANNPNLKRYVQPSDNAADKNEMIALIGKNTNANDWNHIERQAGLNAWIGKLADGSIATIQTMPWNYRPWGCGKGSKGSCNTGWVQFEICEDDLKNKDYFEKTYQEACELTAYICKMYNLDPKGTTTLNGVTVPVILCHADSYKLGLGSNHGDVLHWFKLYGKTMDDVRNDVAALLSKKKITYVKYSKEDFIEAVAKEVNAIREEFGIKVASPIIAQACLESAYGTSNKATHNNYFGLKYRANRCPSSCGTFVDGSSEQLADGTYIPITDQWFEFATLSKGIRGYFEYTSIDRYKELKGETDPKKYLEKIKAAGYATSLTYVESVYNVITKWNLTKYDPKEEQKPEVKPIPTPAPAQPTEKKYYRVRKSWADAKSQIGAYEILENAKKACKDGYFVYDWNGNQVYPEVKKEEPKKETSTNTSVPAKKELKNGDVITLKAGATYYNGKSIPAWVLKKTLYYRGTNNNGVVFSILKTGAVTGTVKASAVNELNTSLTTVAPTSAKKSNETIAKEVIQGKWGNGNTRKQKLTAAGYNYAEIQKIVNKLLS